MRGLPAPAHTNSARTEAFQVIRIVSSSRRTADRPFLNPGWVQNTTHFRGGVTSNLSRMTLRTSSRRQWLYVTAQPFASSRSSGIASGTATPVQTESRYIYLGHSNIMVFPFARGENPPDLLSYLSCISHSVCLYWVAYTSCAHKQAAAKGARFACLEDFVVQGMRTIGYGSSRSLILL